MPDEASSTVRRPADEIAELEGAIIQHGPLSQRVYLMNIGTAEPRALIPRLDKLARESGYSKIFAKVPESLAEEFVRAGFAREAAVPGFFRGTEAAWFLGRYIVPVRRREECLPEIEAVLRLAREKADKQEAEGREGFPVRRCRPQDAEAMSALYRQVFPTYPFPIDDPAYLRQTMNGGTLCFGVEHQGRLVALSSAEVDAGHHNAEMTDFATRPRWRGRGLAALLLARMEAAARRRGVRTAYTIARALSPGMNITFAKLGYQYGGRLINNTNIAGQIESMNVWHKPLSA
jgi:beta-lysine N6-acetyltransferase